MQGYAAIWSMKTKVRKNLSKIDKRLQRSYVCDITDVLSFIGSENGVTVAEIHVNPYFRTIGLSTIKRFVARLLDADLIKKEVGEDLRERILKIK